MITGILSIVLWLGIIPLGIGGILSAGFERKKSNIIQTYLFCELYNHYIINDFVEICQTMLQRKFFFSNKV